MFKTLILTALLSTLAQAQAVGEKWLGPQTGSWSTAGWWCECPPCTLGGNALMFPAQTSIRNAQTPRIGTTIEIQTANYEITPLGNALPCLQSGSYFALMTYGAAANPLFAAAATTGTLDTWFTPTQDSVDLAVPVIPALTPQVRPLVIPNDPALIGSRIWCQATHFWTNAGVSKLVADFAMKITVQP